MLSNQAIQEFQDLCEKRYGEKLSFEEAQSQAERLIRFYKVIFKPSVNKGSSHG